MFLADSAALVGLLLAAVGLGLSHLTGDELWDGLASIGIGLLLLLVVATILAWSNLSLLVGRSVPERLHREIERDLAGLPAVDRVDTLMTMLLGPGRSWSPPRSTSRTRPPAPTSRPPPTRPSAGSPTATRRSGSSSSIPPARYPAPTGRRARRTQDQEQDHRRPGPP
ncbi:hypothetical protein [Micromonospora sp. U56]|uniref:hypothetical protein n=1 Tax=Micromonospora sp. U56 TaxID=2824900 RepID=UPI001FFCC2F3|nr:hypothetical protein [Micromonospora sp. U56]